MDTDKVINIIQAAHKGLSPGAEHDECVSKVCKELRAEGFQVEKEKPLMLADGNEGKPDLTITDRQQNRCIAEIKCKNQIDQGDNAQAEKFKEAVGSNVPVIRANMKPDKPEANIKLF